MAYILNHLDREIVEQLLKDGRMPGAEIARRVGGLTERAVRYRIERLIREGIIRISAVVNPKALGFTVVGDVNLEVESGHVQEVARRITEFDCVGYVACSMGEKDVSIQVNARSTDELYRFVTEVLGSLPWVRKTTTLLVPLKLKDVYEWQIPQSFCVEKERKNQ